MTCTEDAWPENARADHFLYRSVESAL